MAVSGNRRATMLIASQTALTANLERLLALDPVMAELHTGGVTPPLRKRDGGFSGLIGIIMAQQLSVASASAINARLHAAIAPLTPENLLAAPVETLVAAGLSQPKVRAARAVAQAAVDGALPFDALGAMSGEEAHATLVAVSGVGPWTADIYLLFCLGHPDVFPAGDLALQEAARQALHLDARPDTALMATLARRWSPHRGVAALMLWAFYAVTRGRAGVISATPQLDASAASPDRDWRPKQRTGLNALLDISATPTPTLGWPDLMEGIHAADPALRRASAGAMARALSRKADVVCDREQAGVIANRLICEPDLGTRKALIQIAPEVAGYDSAAARLFSVLTRIASGQNATRTADRIAALQALERLARQRPALLPKLRRMIADIDVSASPRLAQAVAQHQRRQNPGF